MKIKPLLVLLTLITMIMVTNVFADTIDDEEDVESSATPTHTLSKDAIGDMLLQSVSLMGIPYRWGGNTPQTGMDCSGFIRYVFKKSLGITLPRTANEMSKLGKRVSIDELQPGDLLFFNIHHLNSHMGMYIGDNKFIQSPHTGDQIKISELDDYWRSRLNGAKRIVAENQDDDGNTTIEDYQEINDEALPSYRPGVHKKRNKHSHHKKQQYSNTNASGARQSSKNSRATASVRSKSSTHRHKHKHAHVAN